MFSVITSSFHHQTLTMHSRSCFLLMFFDGIYLFCQIFPSGTSMARARLSPKAPTATCTSSLCACSGIHSPWTPTNWCSARSWRTTACLQVHFSHFLSVFQEKKSSSDYNLVLCLCRNQPSNELQQGDGGGWRALHLVWYGAGIHTPRSRWLSFQLAPKWIPCSPR